MNITEVVAEMADLVDVDSEDDEDKPKSTADRKSNALGAKVDEARAKKEAETHGLTCSLQPLLPACDRHFNFHFVTLSRCVG